MLRDANLEDSFDFDTLVKATDGMSGSDLKELCRNAAMVPVREYMRRNPIRASRRTETEKMPGASGTDEMLANTRDTLKPFDNDSIRSLKLNDFISLSNMKADLGTKLSYNDRINITPLEYEEAD